MERYRGSLLAEAAVSLFILLVLLAAAVAALRGTVGLAEHADARLSVETARADAIARLAAGVGRLTAADRVTIPGGVAARRLSVPAAGGGEIAVVWPDAGQTP